MSCPKDLKTLAMEAETAAESLSATAPTGMASLALLTQAGRLIEHLHERWDAIPDETKGVIFAAAVTLTHANRLFPPELNFDGSVEKFDR
jgi:hypothetical protein